MFEDIDRRDQQNQEDEEDTETSSYSYPSYSRFTYTGKTKSRLGRSRFMRQTNVKEEIKNVDKDSISNSDLKSTSHFLQSSARVPKTPGVGWLQRDSSAQSYTPVEKSSNVNGSHADISSFPSQSNFLFNLKNDSVQNSSCKRNLLFSTTPFKTKDVPMVNQSISNPLRELNQIAKPENPFSNLNLVSQVKEEGKENYEKSETGIKTDDLDPSWNQLKKICDASIPYPTFSANNILGAGDPSDFRKANEPPKFTMFSPPFITLEKKDEKKDDDSANMPLDLSSADSTTSRTADSKSLSGSEYIDGNLSGFLNRHLKDSNVKKTDDSTAEPTQKTNTDALSGFLPRFLVPKNKNSKLESTEEDVSAHSEVDTVLELPPHPPSQKSLMLSQGSIKSHVNSGENNIVGGTKNEVYTLSQNKPEINNVARKLSPQYNSVNFACKDSFGRKENVRNLLSMPNNKNEFQSSSLLHSSSKQKYSPPSNSGTIMSADTSKVSPPSVSVPDLRSLINAGQEYLKLDQNCYQQAVSGNMHSEKNEKESNGLSQNMETKLIIAPKLPADDQMIPEKNLNQVRSRILSLNEAGTLANHFKPDSQNVVDVINPLPNNQHTLSSSNQVHRVSEPLNTLYSGVRHEQRPVAQPDLGEKSLNQLSVQQTNSVPKQVSTEQRDPVMYVSSQENNQTLLNQKTYLAPQQPSNRNIVGDFPHVKPDVPLSNNKPSFPAMKKQSQFKTSVPRGMPSRVDTELSVNGKSYRILSMLGKGGSSEVYQVLDPTSSKLLAVKCVDLSMVDKTIADGYLNEIDLLSRLQGCASVIRMFDYEYVQECKLLYVVMEKGDTDLSHLIRDISKTKKISMSMIIYYWTEMLQAVKDIHDRGIIHSDLKPANFLLVSGRLKLIDFGIASTQGDMTSVVKEVTTGTWNYMSPEAIKNTSTSAKGFKITYKSDVWSLGCILYNLVYGKTPFSHITNTWGKLTAIADPNHCIEFPDVGAPAVLLKALRSCFHREPKLRPTVAELLNLPYHSHGEDDLSVVGQQVQTILPPQWWLKVAHLFPDLKANQERKSTENIG